MIFRSPGLYRKKFFTFSIKSITLYSQKVLSNRQIVEENSRMRKESERIAGRDPVLEAIYPKVCEDRLGEAPIQPGSSRYLQMSGFLPCAGEDKKGGTA